MYEIISWNGIINKINISKLCNYINDKNEIIDIISLNPLPIPHSKNPNKLVLIIYLINGSSVIHDIINFKEWLERVGSFKEPLSNYRLPYVVLDDIKYKIWESQKYFKKKIIATSYGLKKYNINLLENAINNEQVFSEEYVVLIHLGSISIDSKYIISPINEFIDNNIYINNDINCILNNQDIEEYDFIIDNCKIILNKFSILFNILNNDFNINTFTKFNNILRHTINFINIKSSYILPSTKIEKLLNYIGNSTGQRKISIDIHELKYNDTLYLENIRNKKIYWYVNSDVPIYLPKENLGIGIYISNLTNLRHIMKNNKNTYQIRLSYL
jgi:hypothetical protein